MDGHALKFSLLSCKSAHRSQAKWKEKNIVQKEKKYRK